MENKEIVKATLVAHEAAEQLESVMKQAIGDRRFKMTLEDGRKFRDLMDDAQKLLDQAWMKSLRIPLEHKATLKEFVGQKS